MAETRFIVAGSFIDGSGAEVRRHVFLQVTDTIITAIGPAADLPHNGTATVDDLSHCTILPPLVDCSVALTQSAAVDSRMRTGPDQAGLARHIRDCHAHGVLGVADSGGQPELLKHCHEELTVGSMVDIRAAGDDFLKIAYSANIDAETASPPRLNHEELDRILRRRGEKKAVVVANGVQPVAAALAAGCDAIEQGYGMGEDNLRMMAKKNVLWIPNPLRAKNGLDGASSGGSVCCRFSTRYVAPGKPLPGAEAFWKKMLADHLAQLRLARKLGVTTAVGTGAGSVGILHGESMVEEMKLFIKAGYSLTETIRCASENGARFFGMAKLGALMIGRQATFLLTRGTVQQLPRKLAYLEGIYVDGRPSPGSRN